MTTIFERLKKERLKLGLNQTQFGEIGGVQKGAQIKYESGDRCPDGQYYAAIAAAGADVQYILTGIRSNAIAEESASYSALSKREAALVDNYRHIADEEGKRYVEQSAQITAERYKDETESGTKKKVG